MRWITAVGAVLVVLGGARAETEHPKVNVNFVIHLDPVARPSPEALKAETARRRENLLWLQQFLETIEKQKRPVLNIQIGGDQAEFYLQDDKGLAMFQRFWDDGHMVGTHFHRQAYQGEPHRWANLRPSRPRRRPPELPAGELFTPGMMPESNSLDEYREHWRGHFQFTNRLIAKLSGLTDPAEIRKINNHGNNHTPSNWESAEVLFKEFGITVQTGGRNEMFNTLFGHDVFNPWRPSDQHETKEDLSNRDYVCVPQLAVAGNISPHFGMMQDLAVEAIERRFLQIVAERREHLRMGLPPKIWNFGWTMHSYDLNPEGYQPPRRLPGRPPAAAAPKPPQSSLSTRRGMPRHSRRQKIEELVSWINERFVPEAAVWKTPSQVAEDFYAWEKENEGVSSFNYPHRRVVWEDYPYQLRGAAEALMSSHYVGELTDWTSTGIKLYELERVAEGSEWVEGPNGDAVARMTGAPGEAGETTRLLFGWSDGATETIDLSRFGAAELIVIAGVSGEKRKVDAAKAPIGPEPVVVEVP